MTESYPSEISNKRIKRDFHLFFIVYQIKLYIYIDTIFKGTRVYVKRYMQTCGMYLDK